MDGGDGGAGDGSFDACECIYNHNAGMQRLLSYLRQSQTESTDGEFLGQAPGQDGSRTSDPGNYTGAMLMLGWMLVALVLYMMRPQALRRGANDKSNNNHDSNRDHDHMPPAPPIM